MVIPETQVEFLRLSRDHSALAAQSCADVKFWERNMRGFIGATALLCAIGLSSIAPAQSTASDNGCGEVVTIESHRGTKTRYALARPKPASGARVALILLAGGSGHVNLGDRGCAQALRGNSLVRSIAQFHDLGFITALVDAPSDHHGEDGLAGFRGTIEHAQDLSRVLADLRARTGAQIWVVGTSRGAISAVNVAAHLVGPTGPDGLVITSALMSGPIAARKSWGSQTVFDHPLEAIRIPVLIVGHVADSCIRSPAVLMDKVAARTNGVREQVVVITGGPTGRVIPSVDACEGRSPHGFIEQELEVATGIARFIRGGRF